MTQTRREFLKTSGSLGGATLLSSFLGGCSGNGNVRVNGHLWIYASKFPPNWDSTPVLDQVFSDFKYAGIEGVELMEVNLRHNEAMSNIGALIEKYELPVTGSSYGGNMWDQTQHQKILEDVELVVGRLHQLGGTNFGITVGNARRKKTEDELDAQAEILKKILLICDRKDVIANMHNHTFEVENDLHDLKGTISRVPELKLGPDLNWLIRGGVNPVDFIRTYGKQMVYMHIRDQNADDKWTEYVGEGVTDFPAIASALQEIDFRGEAAIELAADIPPVNPMKENWKKSREYVRQIFGW
ncbi:MAG: TIM barrel protein [Cyclobacteriaceae bacterium]